MTLMRVYTFILVCLCGFTLSACGGEDAVKADSVVIDDGRDAPLLMGEVKISMGGLLGGQGAAPKPAGPVIVYILKDVPKSYVDEIHGNGFLLENNSAYLLPEGWAYHGASIKNSEFIRTIDPALSNDDLAKMFGIVVE